VLPALKSRLIQSREQEPAWPGECLFPCNDLPDIQDPEVSIRPLALPTVA